MNADTEYFSSASEKSSLEDSSQYEASEDEIFHVSPTIRRRRIEPDTEDEMDIENENEHNIEDNEWSNNITQTAASVIPFVKSRTAVQIEGNQPYSFYVAFLTEEILQIIVDETNRYAEQYMQNRRSIRVDKWIPTDKNEMRRFFGLLIWMSLVKLPKYDAYWCTNNTYCQSFPRTVMSRNRFELLLRFLHFTNNQTANTNDRLYKLRQIVDILNQNFSKYYDLDEEICIDESLVPFQGRIKFRQFLKQKRHKYGIKVFKMCSGQGYTYKFEIYSGKNLDAPPCVTPTNVVMNICNNILHRGHTIYTDNWYTSINLAEKLIDCNTHLVGTLKKDRKGIPVDVKFKKLKRGELIAMQNKKGITVLKWRDERDIFMISTKHSAEMVEVHKKNYVCDKPMVVVDYSRGRCAVDLSDQMIAYSTPHRRTLKWYIKLALEFLFTSISNAMILYKQATKTKIKVSDFRMALAMHLTQCHSPEPSDILIRQRLRHEMQKKEGQAYLARKFCRECYKKNVKQLGSKIAKNRTKKVTTYCPDCIDEPHLCLKCFNTVHR